jgi:peptidoglycan/LPS O-acetylase OafA/YrhL
VSVAILVPLVNPGILRSAWDVVLLVTLQGNLKPAIVSSVDVPWWSLTTEVHFYLLVPLLAPLLHRRFGRWGLLAGACALSWWWWADGSVALHLPGSLLPGRLPQFLIGALVGIAVREGGVTTRARAIGASRWTLRAALAGVVFLGLWFGAHGTHHRRDVLLDLWLEPLVGLCLGVLLLCLVVRAEHGHRSTMEHPVLRGAGLMSYSLYLWHYPVLLLCLRHFDVADDAWRAVYAIPVALALTAAATWISYRWVERPLLFERGERKRQPGPDDVPELAPVT